MLKLDSNHGINTINSNYYTTLMEYLIKGNIIKELRQQQGRIAGVFQLIDENLLHTMYQDVSIDILNAKETIILEFYDTALKTNKKVKKK